MPVEDTPPVFDDDQHDDALDREAARQPSRAPACVVVVSAPKAGSGVTSLTAHLAIALLRLGHGVGVIDLDVTERGLTRWLRKRQARIDDGARDLPMPAVSLATPGARSGLDPRHQERARWPSLVEAMADACGILIVDAEPGAGALSRCAHAQADVVISCVAESLADVDLLFETGPDGAPTGRPGGYARMVWDARRKRVDRGARAGDWALTRTRALPDSPVSGVLADRFEAAERLLGARRGARVCEAPAWRVGLEDGLTALDAPADAARGVREAVREVLIAAKLKELEGARLAF